MTKTKRRAIVNYWLLKRWAGLSPEMLKRLARIYRFHFVAVLAAVLGFAGTAFSAEVRTEQSPSPLLKTLDSKAAAAVRSQVKKEKQKAQEKAARKVVLPDPDPEDVKAKGEMKTIEGSIVARNNFGMAVEFKADAAEGSSSEIWVRFHSKMKLKGFKEFKQLGEGDIVRVNYKLTKDTNRIVPETVTFVSRKPKEMPQEEPVAEEANPQVTS